MLSQPGFLTSFDSTRLMNSVIYEHLCKILVLPNILKTGTEVIKVSFMLNSTEHEIDPAHKC